MSDSNCGDIPHTAETPRMDRVMAGLVKTYGYSAAVRRLIVVNDSHSELFDAASVIVGWMRNVRIEDRPIAQFNRLLEAINGVREAHQMEPKDVSRG